jgi:hypothetical protein
MPMHAKRWTVTINIDEVDDNRTRAHAVLETGGSMRITGEGFARRNPTDRPVPEIGDELAAGRALSDLAHHLLDVAADDVAAFAAAHTQ